RYAWQDLSLVLQGTRAVVPQKLRNGEESGVPWPRRDPGITHPEQLVISVARTADARMKARDHDAEPHQICWELDGGMLTPIRSPRPELPRAVNRYTPRPCPETKPARAPHFQGEPGRNSPAAGPRIISARRRSPAGLRRAA